MKVLAIDDQQLVLLPLQKRLLELGYQVEIETSASRGIKLFHSFNPDLVIVDINMPEISGLEIVKYIRSSKNSKVKVMVLSGNTNDAVITKGFDLGIDDYMKKPLSLNEICARVKRLIGAPKINAKESSNVLIQQRRRALRLHRHHRLSLRIPRRLFLACPA